MGAQAPSMPYRPLGRCGLRVSALALGGWTTFGDSVKDPKAVRAILTAAYDAGVNFFDMADAYGRGKTEEAMGAVFREWPRSRLVLSSKLFWPMSEDPNDKGLSRKHIRESVERSLRRIGTDYLDLYFCHRFDEETPVEETARAMDDLVHQGKVLYWGTSEWSGAQIRDAAALCRAAKLYRPQVEQPQYHLLERGKVERDVRPAVLEAGMGMVTWSPLASGLLTGKYDEGVPKGTRLAAIEWLRKEVRTDEDLAKVRRFKAVADRAGGSRAQLAIAWVAAQPGVSSVILGATSVEQLRENLGALSATVDAAVARELETIFPAG